MSDAGPRLPQRSADQKDWVEFFSRYAQIVLVANSDEVDIALLEQRFPDRALFIFFNKVYKVLDSEFRRPALLASRSGMMGANIVHRREVPEVMRHFPSGNFAGILNITIGNDERFSEPAEFGGARVTYLDLESTVSHFYPQGAVPTTGFGLCIWLHDLKLPATITLAGFSSRRSARWKVFDIHDWTFEQVVLRLLARKGEIEIMGFTATDYYAALPRHFPQFSTAEIASTVDQVLSDRLSYMSSIMDHLMSVTKPLRFLDDVFRKHRPKTRKQKHLERKGLGRD